jgi:ligand-binding sensor domain-containing protein
LKTSIATVSISGDLPEAPVNAMLVDPDYPNVLYVGTDVGCYVSANTGASWQVLGTGLPTTPILDLKFHQPTRMLVAGTHGRSLFTITAPEPTAILDWRTW